MTRLLNTHSASPGSAAVSCSGVEETDAYGPAFWLTYLANALAAAAVNMLVRYADFVTYLGGAEAQLGLIVGTGMLGSMAMRSAQGVAIDRYGARRVWLLSLASFAISLVAHLGIARANGPGIYLVRMLMQTSIAGVFGASITSISRRVPPERMAEIVGTLGTSGFLGVLLGPQLSDWICGSGPIGRLQLDRLFLAAASLAVLALVATWWATRGEPHPPRRRLPAMFPVLRRYNPGVVMLVAVAVGGALTIPNTFLRTFADERNIPNIGFFFAVYAVIAFVVRLLTRNLFVRYGNRPWVLLGMGLLCVSFPLYLVVHRPWELVIPGVVAGVAHAVLFPSVVASGSTCFPERYRGLATTLMLAMFDLGSLVGAPLVGGILHWARVVRLPAYPTMFVTMAMLAGSIATVFFLSSNPRSVRGMPPGKATPRPARGAAGVASGKPPRAAGTAGGQRKPSQVAANKR